MKKPNMFKKYKSLSINSIIILIIIVLGYTYIQIIKSEKDNLEDSLHNSRVESLNEQLFAMINDKQKSTAAIAISIANDSCLPEDIEAKSINAKYYETLISQYKNYTLYKNVWIQILDKDLNSLYRSWDKVKSKTVVDSRSDIIKVFITKQPVFSISADKYDLSIKAMMPILNGDSLVGILEVVSHFNSIAKSMLKSGVESAVILNKGDSKKITYPFTKTFIGEYYVANYNAPTHIIDYLDKNGVDNYFKDAHIEENGKLIISNPLKDVDGKVIAYYIMFDKLDKDSYSDLDFFMYKWSAVGIVALMLLGMVVSVLLFYGYRKDKEHYKNIINTSKNLIVITTGDDIVEVNRTFFKYFDTYDTLEDFKEEHSCLCEFFVVEDGFVSKDVDGVNWLDFLLENPSSNNKIKMKIVDKEYYFSVNANLVDKENNYYSIIMSNISEQEKYKNELELLSVTDPMSGINNRRYFETQIEYEISRAKRYKYPLSLIIFDIDYFKKVNDTYGHKVGDEVIIEYSKFIASMLRDEDTFCRIGGEEFSIILPHLDRSKSFKVAEKLRSKVEHYEKVLPITMSFGVVEYIMGEDAENIFHRADTALYSAKDSGRNRVKIG